MSSSYRSVDCIRLISVSLKRSWFSSVYWAPLCLWSSWCYIYIFFLIHPSLYLFVSWAWCDWPLTWLTNHRPSVLWQCWLGHVTRKTVSEMTYNVSSGMLNSTIPYLVFRLFTEILNEVHSSDDIQFSQNGTWTVKSVSSYKPLDDSRSPVVHSVIGLYSLYLHCYHAVAVRHNTLYRIVPCVTLPRDLNEVIWWFVQKVLTIDNWLLRIDCVWCLVGHLVHILLIVYNLTEHVTWKSPGCCVAELVGKGKGKCIYIARFL